MFMQMCFFIYQKLMVSVRTFCRFIKYFRVYPARSFYLWELWLHFHYVPHSRHRALSFEPCWTVDRTCVYVNRIKFVLKNLTLQNFTESTKNCTGKSRLPKKNKKTESDKKKQNSIRCISRWSPTRWHYSNSKDVIKALKVEASCGGRVGINQLIEVGLLVNMQFHLIYFCYIVFLLFFFCSLLDYL